MKTPDSNSKTPPTAGKPVGKVRHEGDRAVWQWAADTARIVALSASQVLRKLDNSSLSIDDDAPDRGKPSARQGAKLPGGGVNPYESRPAVTRGAATAAKPRSPVPAPVRASWWSRLFRRG